RPGHARRAPIIEEAAKAVNDLLSLLKGESRGKGGGFKDPEINPFVRHRLEGMRAFLKLYTDPKSRTYGRWMDSSIQAAITMDRGVYCARMLRKLARQYITDRELLPLNPYGNWNESLLVDEYLCIDINLHLQQLGEKISPKELQNYLNSPEVMEKHGIERKISIWTARRYMKALGFRFTSPKRGQYADGHERDDVVAFRDKVYIPFWNEISERVQKFTADGEMDPTAPGILRGRRIIVWFHDETIFYAHDRRRKSWRHKDALPKIYPKGDGPSYMIADYCSQDFGLLRSPDGCSARRCIAPGKNRDGYFTAEDIQEQAMAAIDLVTELWPNYEHIFVYDNATNHRKREDTALSARKMPLNPSWNFLVDVPELDANGNKVYKPNGSLSKVKRQMAPGTFADGTPQELYYPSGQFKGMRQILTERGIHAKSTKKSARMKN
ncbi:hypothetical protein BT96DRAFT_790326, partial [Gymnopus androsaceus JB14]